MKKNLSKITYALLAFCLLFVSNVIAEVDGENGSGSNNCAAGQYYVSDTGSCLVCPVGYKCIDNAKIKCDGNLEYQDEPGQSSCKYCIAGDTPNDDHTGCVEVNVSCDAPYTNKDLGTGDSDHTCIITCAAGKHVNTAGGECVQCTGNTISQQHVVEKGETSDCTPCSGSTPLANSDHTACVANSENPSTEFIVTLDANGSTIPSTTGWTIVANSSNKKATKSFTSGSTLGTLPDVTREGYTLDKWNTKADGTGTTYTSSSTVSSALTLYAIWKEVTPSGTGDSSGGGSTEDETNILVTFNANGGKILVNDTQNDSVTIEGIATDKVSDKIDNSLVTREGYNFIGWYDSSTDGTLV